MKGHVRKDSGYSRVSVNAAQAETTGPRDPSFLEVLMTERDLFDVGLG